jgi:hypothetical protein
MHKKMFIIAGIFIVFSAFLTGQIYGQDQDNPQLKTVEGKVVDLFGQHALLQADDGIEYEVFLGPPWFLMDRDVFLRIGDKVRVEGEIEEYRGLSTIYPYSLQLGEDKIAFVDDEGYALWDYRGYRNYSGFSNYRNRLPRRYMNRPYGLRDDGGYYRSYRRDQRFDRGLFREDKWRINGETGWMSGRRWRGYGCPYRGLSRDYYYTPRKNYPYRYRYYREY